MRILTLICASIASITLGCMLPTLDYVCESMWHDYHVIERKGSEKLSLEYQNIVAQAMNAMNIKRSSCITLYKTTGVSAAGAWHVWINEHSSYGPVVYEIFHECAHIALGHFKQRFNKVRSDEFIKAQEIEADLYACQKLFEIGMQDVIVQRISKTKPLINKRHGSSKHPSYKEMYGYFMHFAESKGIKV